MYAAAKSISPFKQSQLLFDSAFPYEIAVMNETATNLFSSIPEASNAMTSFAPVLRRYSFSALSTKLVASDALIREFIGGDLTDI